VTAEARGPFEPATLRRWVPVGAVAVVVVGVAAMMVARELVSPAPDPPAPAAAEDSVRFRDAAGGLSISYPTGWERVTSPDPEVRLIAQGEGSSMLVRMTDLGFEVGAEDLGAAKRLTDKLVRAAGQAKLVRPPRQVALGGLPGYLYLYTFADPTTGARGAHAHYFLFRGRTLITIVFQTAPPERLTQLAPLFDRIGESLEVTSG